MGGVLRRLLELVARHRRLALTSAAVEIAVAAVLIATASGGRASGIVLPPLPSNDLQNLLALTGYPTPKQVPVQDNPQPPLAPSPPAVCGAGSTPLAGEQGRVDAAAINSPQAASGWTCNLSEVSHFSTPGGFRVWRYVDSAGHVCAFYDTSLFSLANVASLAAGPSPGVVVLDMDDPAHPVQTDLLTSLPMLAPHESLNLNSTRGLLAAEMGNGTTLPGLMAIYSVSQDCRHPVLDATYLASRFGHESGFSPDGNTFYIGGGEGIAAVDVSDPKHPRTLWDGNVFAHGLNVSPDGDTLYDSNPIDGQLILLDVSQIQDRVPHPQVKEISRLTWDTVSVPQNTDPFETDGHKYLLEFDEFAFRFNPATVDNQVGAARIINIDNPLHPYVVSNLRLAVNMPAEHAAADGDPSGVETPATTYAAHYCQIPEYENPEIVACSFINSGLRVFNIADPAHPREVAYFISPPKAGGEISDVAFSQPAFDPASREIWYSDAGSGFYVLKLAASVWPHPDGAPSPGLPPVSGSGTATPVTCVAPTGSLGGGRLADLSLGETRSAARHSYPVFRSRGAGNFDRYCLSGGGLRAGYPSARLLRSLSPRARRRLRDRIVLALTSSRYYRLRGVTSGMALRSRAVRALHPAGGYRIGANTWYLVAGDGVLEARDGIVSEIGIVNHSLTRGSSRARYFFGSFG